MIINICGDCVWYVKRKKIDSGRREKRVDSGRDTCVVKKVCIYKVFFIII